jgi:hypothetical protein
MHALPPWVCNSAEWCLSDFPMRLLEVCHNQKCKRSFIGHWSTSIEPRLFSDSDFLQSEVSEQLKKTGIWTQESNAERNCKSTCPWRRRQQRTIRLLVV